MPDYLYPDSIFLGRYLIKEVVPYTFIYEKNLLAAETVFKNFKLQKGSILQKRSSKMKLLESRGAALTSSNHNGSDRDEVSS